ncbi:conserved hypothetical protein [Microbacterium sp. 8M]|uniref:DUF6098 family protein n=1 Tax=Microbacterium sp. 8M TaxID=2653153 RepID=UPI0012F41ED6|nr:DUF6098 family protein [Microbacterium sp. 8M]VXA99260.1 conserved hypothetical protein [Microbacterium sp. 8M]
MVMTDVEDRAKHSDLPVYGRLREVVCLVESVEPLYVRYSEDPRGDVGGTSIDGESGLPLPGLSASPLTPESWWTRPVEQWAARQLMKYRHLEHEGDGRVAWILTGSEVGRGPDAEPLLADVIPVAVLAESVLDEADELYSAAFDRGQRVADSRQ